MRTGDEGRNYILHLFICQHRHRAAFEVTYGEIHKAAQPAKEAVEETSNRAGATPLFRLSAAQVNRGVAPALRRSGCATCLVRRPLRQPRQSYARCGKTRSGTRLSHRWGVPESLVIGTAELEA